MANAETQDDNLGGLADGKTSEGVSVEVPYRDSEDAIIADIIGGLRSGLTYGGAVNIRELQGKLDFIRISEATKIEGCARIERLVGSAPGFN